MLYAAVQRFFVRLSGSPLPLRLVGIALVALLAGLPLVVLTALVGGPAAAVAPLTAEFVCVAGVAMGELAAALVPPAASLAYARYVLGMFPRLGVPLGLGVWLQRHDAALSAAGFIFYVIFFYMLTLTLEVVALVAALPRRRAQGVA
ncbi:MAG: hypothetical protein U0836_19130 [Pirellulales bacterium]